MNKLILSAFFCGVFICCSIETIAQKKKENPNSYTVSKETARKNIQDRYDYYKERALQIWNFAEVGYKEVKSSSLLQQTLRENGFTVEAGVAGIPTAFVATYGNGGPVIGILAEYDALPGLAQQAIPSKEKADGNAGHGCGHHLFGVVGDALLKNWDRTSDLNKIAVPTLTIGGEFDTMDPKAMEKMSTLVQKGSYLYCSKGSHMSMYDDQETYFNGVISFLKKL